MNRFQSIIMIALSVFIASCDNDLDLVSDYENIPVTYGLLDRSDTAQYIRVEKAFVDPEKSALLLAQEPDSLYYEDLVVQLVNRSLNQTYTLERVDGNLEGYPRDTGIFASSPNWMYKIRTSDMTMRGGDNFRILIDRGEPFETIEGNTTVIGDFELIRPRPGSTVDFSGFGDFSVVWTADPAAAFHDILVRIYISEWETGSSDPKRVVEIPWTLARSLTDSRVNVPRREFFSLLANRLEANPNTQRTLDSMRLEIKAGGDELYDFIRVSLANAGITASQDIPRVTNMSEGFGVFSSTNGISESDFDFSSNTFDSLTTNTLTRDLNFQ